ncbi:MAG TPA: hypothetical protein VIN03_11985 [Roseateles sp.]
MTVKQPINPSYGSTKSVTAGTSAGNLVIDAQRGSKSLRLINLSANVIYVRTWDSNAGSVPSATAADFPIAPNQATTITKQQEHDTLCHLAETGSSRFLASLGEGW